MKAASAIEVPPDVLVNVDESRQQGIPGQIICDRLRRHPVSTGNLVAGNSHDRIRREPALAIKYTARADGDGRWRTLSHERRPDGNEQESKKFAHRKSR